MLCIQIYVSQHKVLYNIFERINHYKKFYIKQKLPPKVYVAKLNVKSRENNDYNTLWTPGVQKRFADEVKIQK